MYIFVPILICRNIRRENLTRSLYFGSREETCWYRGLMRQRQASNTPNPSRRFKRFTWLSLIPVGAKHKDGKYLAHLHVYQIRLRARGIWQTSERHGCCYKTYKHVSSTSSCKYSCAHYGAEIERICRLIRKFREASFETFHSITSFRTGFGYWLRFNNKSMKYSGLLSFGSE